MEPEAKPKARIAIACGGTGGHLFPGLAIAEEFLNDQCTVTAIISEKEIDQQGIGSSDEIQVISLPSVALTKGGYFKFASGFWKSLLQVRREFIQFKPDAVLAMGGFTSAPPIVAGKMAGAKTFLHEANSIPGRANRLLAPYVVKVFTGFPGTGPLLNCNMETTCVGMPVRSQFEPGDAGAARIALGLIADSPTLLVMGGSQGASGINKAVLESLPVLCEQIPSLQFLHLTGKADFEQVRTAYASFPVKSVVLPFLTEMELALAAATVAVSRSGASSLAEFAAMGVPSLLVPYPIAADNHQFYNARAYAQSGAALMLEQREVRPETLLKKILPLLTDSHIREQMSRSVSKWHRADAAAHVVQEILKTLPLSVHCNTATSTLRFGTV
ncbi:MAG: undecaprenyldiphospho-muramoylpentapeptide beta-N-acetylglucosaminyltransferase [Verrucomicrobiota bacterium]|nr:undecaprenyldiphospho-muramoylpentapeptide beta-N-acetylglucosaminyltransferase [Verrucomicrobiota bacterium]